MGYVTQRKGGRPKSTQADWTRLYEDCQRIWLIVAQFRVPTSGGRRLSIKRACRQIAAVGGLAWVCAGDPSVSRGNKKKKHRRNYIQVGERMHFMLNAHGGFYVTRLIEEARTIETMYHRACRWVKRDENVAAAWENLLRDLRGEVRTPPRDRFSHAPFPV